MNRLRALAGCLVLLGLVALVSLQPRSTDARFADAEVGTVSITADSMPAMTSLTCTGTGVLGQTRALISWTRPSGLPAGAEYRMRVTVPGKPPVDVYLSATTTSYEFSASISGPLAVLLSLATPFTVELTPVLRDGQTEAWTGTTSSINARSLLNLIFRC